MLHHLQLVLVFLVSSQNEYDAALANFYLRRDTLDPSALLPIIFASTYVAVFGLADRTACIGDRNCPFEFLDNFFQGVMVYLRSVFCIEGTRYMTSGTSSTWQNNFYALLFP